MKIDVIGDVHGCIDELHLLFKELGYTLKNSVYVHPDKRIPIFLGDITDRGPNSIAVIQFVYKHVIEHKKALYVPGNHCNKLYRFFIGNNVKLLHGIETTVTEYEQLDSNEQEIVRNQFTELYENAPLYLHLPEVNALIVHAAMKTEYIGRTDKEVKSYVLYGDVTGEFDERGKPIRRDWAKNYRGSIEIIYGHTPVLEPRIINNTINIDTGCVFGNALTAYRLPEQEICAVPSQQPFKKKKFTHFD